MKSLAIMLLAVMAIGTTSQAYEVDDFVKLDSPLQNTFCFKDDISGIQTDFINLVERDGHHIAEFKTRKDGSGDTVGSVDLESCFTDEELRHRYREREYPHYEDSPRFHTLPLHREFY